MKIAHFLGLALVVGTMAGATSGCFATRMVRTDTTTSYAIVEAPPSQPAPSPPLMVAAPAPQDGTLVVEALVVPAPPASAARPVRLPDAVAAVSAPSLPVPPLAAPRWDPLPSYVGQFTGPGWQHRTIFGGSAQSSTSFRRWGPIGSGRVMTVPSGYLSAPGAYGSASPHFSSPPSFSGSVSSHFSGGYPGSGY